MSLDLEQAKNIVYVSLDNVQGVAQLKQALYFVEPVYRDEKLDLFVSLYYELWEKYQDEHD